MTADEIRANESGESAKGNEISFWLREIAAQLAELNKRLKGWEARDVHALDVRVISG